MFGLSQDSGSCPIGNDDVGNYQFPEDVYAWIDVVSRLRFGKSINGVAGRTIKLVAFRLGYFADPDGTRVYPGPARMSLLCEVDYKTVKRVYQVLRHLGLILKVGSGAGPKGGRRFHADEYRLTFPLDMLERLAILSPLDLEREIERIRVANRKKDPAAKSAGTSEAAVDKPSQDGLLRGRADPVTDQDQSGDEGPDEKDTGNSEPPDEEIRGTPDESYGEQESAVPTTDLPRTSTNHDRPDPQVTTREGRPVDKMDSNLEDRTKAPGCRHCKFGYVKANAENADDDTYIYCPHCHPLATQPEGVAA